MAGRLGPGIDRRPSGLYRARVHLGGNRYRSESFRRAADARAWKEEVERARATGRIETHDQTLAELAAEHMHVERPNLSDNTYAAYRALWVAHVRDHGIASMAVAAIRPEHVEQWLADRRAAGSGDQALRKTMMVMQSVFERAVRARPHPAG